MEAYLTLLRNIEREAQRLALYAHDVHDVSILCDDVMHVDSMLEHIEQLSAFAAQLKSLRTED